jgi:hypothetical protein
VYSQWEKKTAQDDAQVKVDAAFQVWDAKRKEVTDGSRRLVDEYLKQVDALQGNIDQVQRDYNRVLNLSFHSFFSLRLLTLVAIGHG